MIVGRKKMWVYCQKPAKLCDFDKASLKHRIQKFIDASGWLKEAVCRIAIRGGRITLYHLIEQYRPEERHFTKPLIDGKYFEFPLARLTFYDKKGNKCTLDWQRHTGQWYPTIEGSLNECLQFLQEHKEIFDPF